MLVVSGPMIPFVPCEHCHGSGRNAGIDCGLCRTTGRMPEGTECPCPACREARALGWSN
jgi:hypothetical protein